MEPLGEYLKKARKKKRLSLEQIASQTRIQEHHLQALESEDFANLPAKVFAKGFVRSYAKALGLDEEEALQSFLETSGTFYEQSQPAHPQPHVQVKLEAAPHHGMNWNLILGLLVLLAIGAFWYGLPKEQEIPIALPEPKVSSSIEPIEEPVPPMPDPAKSVEPIKPAESVPQPARSAPVPTPPTLSTPVPSPPPLSTPVPSEPAQEPVPTTPVEPTPQAPPPKPVEGTNIERSHALEIEATQLTWVVVKSDKQAPNEALLQPGQRKTWKAHQQFLLTLGNAAGVVIRLNGEPQGPFGKPGQVVRDIRLRP